VDPITHALVAAIGLSLAGRPDLVPYGIAGAVLIDVDVLFTPLSDRDPGLYIFTHGGFTHSFFGAFTISLFVAISALLLSGIGPMPPFSVAAFGAILAGALSHIMVDYLAHPGIPLLYPASDKKHTLGIMGGPSAIIMLASVAYLGAMAMGVARADRPWPYITVFALVAALGAGSKIWVRTRTKGRTIATTDPFKWAVIEDTPGAYLYYKCDLLGRQYAAEEYVKYRGITPAEAGKNDSMPEVRRLRYHSYVVTIEKDSRCITYRDPIREKGHIWYPPYYKKCRIPASGP